MREVKTDTTGHYDFAVPDADYFVVPEPDRLWNSTPGQIPLRPNNIVGSGNFEMRFVPAKVSFAGQQMTFVLITTYSYTDTTPPPVGAGYETMRTWSYTIGQITPPLRIGLSGGFVYWFKCWTLAMIGQAKFRYVVGPPQQINGGNVVWPLDQFTETCL